MSQAGCWLVGDRNSTDDPALGESAVKDMVDRRSGQPVPRSIGQIYTCTPMYKLVRIRVGQPVEVSAQDSNVLVRALGEPKLTLAQKLTAFDPALHCGEAMATRPVGREVL